FTTKETFGAQRETGKNKESSSNNALDYNNNRGTPFFDKAASKNVTALLGKTAYLNCRVKNLGNKTTFFNAACIQRFPLKIY
ncbi:hypothetical protein Phum_PHUM170540, partial [Pediculus humanus corporis]